MTIRKNQHNYEIEFLNYYFEVNKKICENGFKNNFYIICNSLFNYLSKLYHNHKIDVFDIVVVDILCV